MANLFVTLPQPVGNGTGAAADVSALGSIMTFTMSGSGGVYEPIVNLEVSLDAAGANWSPLASFQGKKERQITVAAHFVRQRVNGFVDGVQPSVSVGADDLAPTFATLAAPAGNGSGAALLTSGLPGFKTVQVTGPFGGTVNVEISDDGGATFSTVMSFRAPGVLSATFTCDHMRITRSGVPMVAPGLPVVSVAASPEGSGSGAGGGGGGSLAPENFIYTVTGAEPGFGTSLITVALKTPRGTTNYSAIASDGGKVDGNQALYTCPQSGYTLTTVQVKCSVAAAVNDKIILLVQDLS